MLKQVVLDHSEIEFIRWKVWEPLRRNQDYRNDYARLKDETGYFLDPEKTQAFCQKWRLLRPIDPACEFSSLYPDHSKQSYRKIQSLFLERYKPLFDHAAFVPLTGFIVNKKYLRTFLDLRSSRNRIENALKKVLDEWHRDKWTGFYNGKRLRRIAGKAILTRGLEWNILEIHVNLEAPRSNVERELESILFEYVEKWKGEKELILRFHGSKWETAFKVYDMKEVENKPFPNIATETQLPLRTVYDLHKRAWTCIYSEPYPTKRYRKREIAKESLGISCANCPKRQSCRTECEYIKKYTYQDFVRGLGNGAVSEDFLDHKQPTKKRLTSDDQFKKVPL